MKTPNGANAEANAEAEVETPIEAKETPSPEAASNRLLEESKKFKERALRAERELEATRKKALEEQGNYKKMYEETQEKYSGLQKSLIKERVKTSVQSVASKLGCVDVEALLSLGNKDLLQYDEESHSVHGADLFVEEAKKTRPYLFSQGKPPAINPASPSAGQPAVEKTLEKMSRSERAVLLAKAFEAQNK